MFSPLRHPAYARLFSAQVGALLGTGLATVALGLLAHEIAGASAGEILGAMLALGVSPDVALADAETQRAEALLRLERARAIPNDREQTGQELAKQSHRISFSARLLPLFEEPSANMGWSAPAQAVSRSSSNKLADREAPRGATARYRVIAPSPLK
jgi:hypothetical protein